MEIFILLCLLGLSGCTGRHWQEMQSLKAQTFLSRLGDQERAVRGHIHVQRLDAQRRMRDAERR